MANRWEYHQDGRDWAASIGTFAILAGIVMAMVAFAALAAIAAAQP